MMIIDIIIRVNILESLYILTLIRGNMLSGDYVKPDSVVHNMLVMLVSGMWN